jgi:hypothetical protein
MDNISFQGMGIPPGYGFKKLLFSPVANVLVVHAQSAANNWRPERLYFRHASQETYRLICEPGDLHSQECPVVHPSKPLLAYNLMEHRFAIDAKGEELHSAEWGSIRVFNLETGTEVASVCQRTLQWPAGTARGWISEIVQFCELGLFVCAGLSTNPARMDYFVASLDLGGCTLKPIVPLRGVFM